jgi:DNA processing protein
MKRRALTGGERADWLRLARTRGIGPITFFHLLDRYDGSAAAVLADLPNLAKKAGAKAGIAAPPPIRDRTRDGGRAKARRPAHGRL